MPDQPSALHFREIAAVRPRAVFPFAGFERLGEAILRSSAFAESTARFSGPGLYALFDEMEDKDPHLFSILQTRKFGLLARPRRIEPASATTEDRDRAGWLGRLLDDLPAWDGALMHLLDALS